MPPTHRTNDCAALTREQLTHMAQRNNCVWLRQAVYDVTARPTLAMQTTGGNARLQSHPAPAARFSTRAVVGMTEATARVDSVSQKKVSGLCWAEKRSTHAWPGLLRAAWLKAAVVPSSIYNDINLGISLLPTMLDHLVWRLNHCLGTYRRLRWFEPGFCGGLLRGPVTKWH